MQHRPGKSRRPAEPSGIAPNMERTQEDKKTRRQARYLRCMQKNYFPATVTGRTRGCAKGTRALRILLHGKKSDARQVRAGARVRVHKRDAGLPLGTVGDLP